MDYKKNAYQRRQAEVKKLLEQSEKGSKPEEKFFRPNNPVMWISGIVLVGIVVGGVILIVRSRRRTENE